MAQSRLRSYALNLLAYREHSQLELQQKLSKKDFAPEEIETVIKELAEQKLQSDERFAESYTNMRSRKGFGPIKIRLELQERGITPELIDQFLSKSDQKWFDLAMAVNEKKFGQTKSKDLKQKVKQTRYLHYKGFTNDQIRSVTDEKKLDYL